MRVVTWLARLWTGRGMWKTQPREMLLSFVSGWKFSGGRWDDDDDAVETADGLGKGKRGKKNRLKSYFVIFGIIYDKIYKIWYVNH